MKIEEESGWIDINGDFRKDRQHDHSGEEIPIKRYVPLEIAEALERDKEAAERRAAGLEAILASVDPWPDQPIDTEARPSDGYCELFVRHIIQIREALAAKEQPTPPQGDE